MVVFLHATAPLLYDLTKIPLRHWMYSNLYDSSVRMCVPLLLMLSGALLIDRDDSIKEYARKRLQKAAIPLLIWSLFFLLWKTLTQASLAISVQDLISILYQPTYYHLWFFYPLLAIYLLIPLIRIIRRNGSENILVVLLALWFLTSVKLPFLGNFIGLIQGNLDLHLLGYLGYPLLGYFLSRIRITNKGLLAAFWILITSILFTTMGTYRLTLDNNLIFDESLYDYLSINVVLSAGSFMLIVRQISSSFTLDRSTLMINAANMINRRSLGVLMSHPIFLTLLAEGNFGFSLSGFIGNPLFSIPATAAAAFLLSYLLTLIVERVPLLRMAVP